MREFVLHTSDLWTALSAIHGVYSVFGGTVVSTIVKPAGVDDRWPLTILLDGPQEEHAYAELLKWATSSRDRSDAFERFHRRREP